MTNYSRVICAAALAALMLAGCSSDDFGAYCTDAGRLADLTVEADAADPVDLPPILEERRQVADRMRAAAPDELADDWAFLLDGEVPEGGMTAEQAERRTEALAALDSFSREHCGVGTDA